VARIILDLPDELVSELRRRADRNDVSVTDLVRRTLEFHFPQLPGRPRGDISNRPEVRRAVQIMDETRKRHEDSGYSGSEFIRRMRDGG
jgi:hypothetical protein